MINPKTPKGWPKPLASAAKHGLLGKFVKLVLPNSEADESGLLIGAAVAIGNLFGRNCFFTIEADAHHCNENILFVGNSSVGRKGTAQGWINRLLDPIDPVWTKNRKSGMSSGEGLIQAVRDPMVESISDNSNESPFPRLPRIIDPGVSDKRVYVLESEFGSVLKQGQRDGNILSTIIRDIFDGRDLRILTKRDPLTATKPHISIAGHITGFELKKLLSDSDLFNGFGNRFLYVSVSRSKSLPLGGKVSEELLQPLRNEIIYALVKALESKEISFASDAKLLWENSYDRLTRDVPGLLGAITARGPAHVIRLSMIYALLDRSDTIELPHLSAALAIWEFCFDSAKFIFGDCTGNRRSDRILEEIRLREKGMSQTEICDLFNRNTSRVQILDALEELEASGLVYSVKDSSGAGRPILLWHSAKANELNELNEKSSDDAGFNSLTRLTRTETSDSVLDKKLEVDV